MVKAKAVKAPKTKAKVAASSSLKIPVQSTHPLSCSPTTRSNTASIRNGQPILDANEQRLYKLWISEIKQLQGLIIAKCGLAIQESSTCPQLLQENAFTRDFPLFYEAFTKDPILGSRVSKIPLKFLTVGTSRAFEIINGEKMRKKYSTMKTYMNNNLTPIFKRCAYN